MTQSIDLENIRTFEACFCKVSNLSKQQSKNYSAINEILNFTDTINYEMFPCNQEKRKFSDLLINLVSSDQTESVYLVNKTLLKLIQCGTSLNKETIFWLSDALIVWSTSYSIVPALLILQSLLHPYVTIPAEKYSNILVGIKKYIFSDNITDNLSELFLCTLKLIRTLISMTDFSDNVNVVQDIVFGIMKHNKIRDINRPLISQLLLLEIDIINIVCEKNSLWLIDELGSILGICLVYSSYGLKDNNHTTNAIPCLVPSPMLAQENNTKGIKENPKSKHRRKQKKRAIEKVKILKAATMEEPILPELYWCPTSESDYSDTENGRNCMLRKSEKKVRIAALSLLLYVVRTTDKKTLIGHWNNILGGQHSIIDCLKSDYSPQCKITITAILMILFNNGKTYIAQAQHSVRNNTISYTTWFDLLADLICVVHRALIHVFIHSPLQSKVFLSALLKCLAVVISCTPYSRLKQGLLTDVISAVRPLLTHSDHSIRILVLKCFKEVIILEPKTNEQMQIIQNCDYGPNTTDASETRRDPWIISYCYNQLRDEKNSTLLRGECWITIAYFSKYHFEIIPHDLLSDMIFRQILNDLKSPYAIVQQCALKALEYLAIPISGSNSKINCLELWHLLLSGPLVSPLQSTSGVLVASACDCISNISADVFEQLPEKLRIFVITVLFGCAIHEHHLARAAAVRSIGVIISFPFLSRDIQIIYDASERVVQAMKDVDLPVRIKSAWAFGNVAEVLLQSRSDGVSVNEVPLLHLLEVGLKTGRDDEKVKTSSMRPMGYLLQLLDKTNLSNPDVVNLVNDIIHMLIVNATTEGNMKVRWNACYSIGNMLKNDELISSTVKWKDPTLTSVSALIITCPNFKVRQSACNAISQLQRRDLYDPHFHRLWITLIEAIKNAQSLTDFSEYKHQRNLIEQLYCTFCHFVILSTIEDFNDDLYNAIQSQSDLMQTNVADIVKQNSDGTQSFFDAASDHIDRISSEQLNCDQSEKTVRLVKQIICSRKSSSDEQLIEHALTNKLVLSN